jgi:hypothetical protein
MTQDLKQTLTLSFYSHLLASFGNDRDFDHELADELAEIAIHQLNEREAKLIKALETLRVATCRQPKSAFDTQERWDKYVKAHFEVKALFEKLGIKT